MTRQARDQADAEQEPRSVRRGAGSPDRSTADRDCDADDGTCGLGRLHDLAGNQAIQRLSGAEGIQRSAVDGGAAGDPFEREAEQVAEAVVGDDREPDVSGERGSDGGDERARAADETPTERSAGDGLCGRCQRRRREGRPLNCPGCEATLQRATAAGVGSGAPSVSDAPAAGGTDRAAELASDGASYETGADLEASGGSGRPLPDSLRSEFEPRFGRDFGGVRVHTGPRAGDVARDLDALAFTIGHDVYFRPGAYRPSTTSGKRLLAHELTHVVQQGRSEPETGDRSASEVRTTTPDATGASSASRGDAMPAARQEGSDDPARERPDVRRREEPGVRRQVLGIAQGAGTLLGETWLRLGRATKERFIGRAINAAIGAIDRFPGQSLLGGLWTFVKPGLLGFYRQLQTADVEAKITAMDKLARIMAGQSLEYARGLLVGTVKGFFVDGLWGIFEAIGMIVRGISGLWDLFWAIQDAIGAFPDAIAELFANARQLAEAIAGSIQPALQEVTALLSSPQAVSELIGPIVEAGQERASALGATIADKLLEFFTKPGAEAAVGEVTGRVIGVVLFEALFAYLTAGAGTAVTAVKTLGRTLARLGGRMVSSALQVFRTLLPYVDVAVDAVRQAGRFLRGRVLGTIAERTGELLTSVRNLLRRFLAHCRHGSIVCDFPGHRAPAAGRGARRARELGWPDPPQGHEWVMGPAGRPYVRQIEGHTGKRWYFDEANGTFVERPPRRVERPPLHRGEDVPRAEEPPRVGGRPVGPGNFRRFSEPLRGQAAERQRRILELAETNPQQAGREYQTLIAEDLGGVDVQELFPRPGRRPDIGTGHEVTIEGWRGTFSSSKLDQLWLDMRDQGRVMLTVPRLSREASDQLRRLAAQAEEVFDRSVLLIIRETLP